jgi:hypothetical protein
MSFSRGGPSGGVLVLEKILEKKDIRGNRVLGTAVILLFRQIFVGAELSVGIKNRLYLASSRPGVDTGYSSTFVVSRITLCVIIDRSAIG